MSRRTAGEPVVLSDEAFAALMAPLGPYEPKPRLAVGLSGGADSLALTVLLKTWCERRDGSLTALVVDHGLRPESAAEARAVARQAKGLGVASRLLSWRGRKPAANLQAEARTARRALLQDWCERAGVLHLALAHQRDDQAETLLLNLARGSGLDGLSGMAPLSESGAVRLLRPLLAVARAELEALLRARGLAWVEDPSNRDPRFARIRLRQAMPELAAGPGLTAERLAGTAESLARARAALETQTAALLARAVRLDPAGYLILAPEGLTAAPDEVGLRALARILTTIGGTAYPPRFERLRGLHGRLRGDRFKGATLGGCRLSALRDGILVTREGRAVERLERLPGAGLWDGRFHFRLARDAASDLRLGPLGRGVGEAWPEGLKGARWRQVPAAARTALPAFRDPAGLVAVPQLDFFRDSAARRAIRDCRFAPRTALSAAGFTVA